MTENNPLRWMFNEAAQDYNAIRPGYPEQLFEDVIAFSGIPLDGQALEIGCGTGQATLPFAQRGFHILCLDIGADLLKFAAQNLRAYPKVQFENISFESWPVQEDTFDLVYAATSFHWIPPEVGYPKAIQALKPGGTLAIFSNTHPRPLAGFFEDVQPVYRKYMLQLSDPNDRPTTTAAIAAQVEFLESTDLFRSVEVRTYPWTKIYTTSEYLQLLNTYSDHLALPKDHRQALYQAIGDLIENRFDGKVERPYLTEIFLAKKPAFPHNVDYNSP